MKLYYVEWVDSAFVPGAWVHKRDLEVGTCVCKSVGFLFRDEKDYIVLVASCSDDREDPDDAEYFGVVSIPKVAILKKKVLKL